MEFLTKTSLVPFSDSRGRVSRCDTGPSGDSNCAEGPVMVFVTLNLFDQFALLKK